MEKKSLIEYCPQHGYPLPCDKCGYGFVDAVFKQLDSKIKYVGNDNCGSYTISLEEYQELKEYWGIK